MMDALRFFFIGFGAWFFVGVVMFAYLIPLYVSPKAGFWTKVMTVLVSGFVLPWIYLRTGRLPSYGMVIPNDMDATEQARLDQWKKDHCPCPRCRARRGEV